MKVKVCPECGTHNPEEAWTCAGRSCAAILSMADLIEVGEGKPEPTEDQSPGGAASGHAPSDVSTLVPAGAPTSPAVDAPTSPAPGAPTGPAVDAPTGPAVDASTHALSDVSGNGRNDNGQHDNGHNGHRDAHAANIVGTGGVGAEAASAPAAALLLAEAPEPVVLLEAPEEVEVPEVPELVESIAAEPAMEPVDLFDAEIELPVGGVSEHAVPGPPTPGVHEQIDEPVTSTEPVVAEDPYIVGGPIVAEEPGDTEAPGVVEDPALLDEPLAAFAPPGVEGTAELAQPEGPDVRPRGYVPKAPEPRQARAIDIRRHVRDVSGSGRAVFVLSVVSAVAGMVFLFAGVVGGPSDSMRMAPVLLGLGCVMLSVVFALWGIAEQLGRLWKHMESPFDRLGPGA